MLKINKKKREKIQQVEKVRYFRNYVSIIFRTINNNNKDKRLLSVNVPCAIAPYV